MMLKYTNSAPADLSAFIIVDNFAADGYGPFDIRADIN
jgi:hypothetical protein